MKKSEQGKALENDWIENTAVNVTTVSLPPLSYGFIQFNQAEVPGRGSEVEVHEENEEILYA